VGSILFFQISSFLDHLLGTYYILILRPRDGETRTDRHVNNYGMNTEEETFDYARKVGKCFFSENLKGEGKEW
jgi:hypothetical protein